MGWPHITSAAGGGMWQMLTIADGRVGGGAKIWPITDPPNFFSPLGFCPFMPVYRCWAFMIFILDFLSFIFYPWFYPWFWSFFLVPWSLIPDNHHHHHHHQSYIRQSVPTSLGRPVLLFSLLIYCYWYGYYSCQGLPQPVYRVTRFSLIVHCKKGAFRFSSLFLPPSLSWHTFHPLSGRYPPD